MSNNFQISLYLVATPIGHLKDISERAIGVLCAAEIIVCENPRYSQRLLDSIGSRPKHLLQLTDHANDAQVLTLLAKLEGKITAYISDAGMPAISDPGANLVRLAHQKGLPVSVVPGPSSVTSAVALSGFLSHAFSFHGFLPTKQGDKEKIWQQFKSNPGVYVCFESPNRLIKTLESLAESLGDRCKLFVIKEITKMFEKYWRGAVVSVLESLRQAPIKGEFVLVIEVVACASDQELREKASALVRALYNEGVSMRSASIILSQVYDVSKNRSYEWVKRDYQSQDL